MKVRWIKEMIEMVKDYKEHRGELK